MRTLVLEDPPAGRMTRESTIWDRKPNPSGQSAAQPIQCQTQLVLHHVRRQTGVLREVIALWVRLQGELDAHATQCLLERFGGGLLLGPLGPVGDVRLEAVRLSTGFK
jgi:hypothetical protein